jgi:hypothetical protein
MYTNRYAGLSTPINSAACIRIPRPTSTTSYAESNIFSSPDHILHISFPHNSRDSMGSTYKVKAVGKAQFR